jgi:transcriptional regulator with XRE-family HTH domain
MEKTIHQGRNVKRFREMLGIKQEALAVELGDDWNQKKVSLLENKEIIDEELLEKIANALNVTSTAIKSLSEEAVYNFINNFNDNSVNHGPINNHYCTFNPIDKIVELYEALIKCEREKLELVQTIYRDNTDKQ